MWKSVRVESWGNGLSALATCIVFSELANALQAHLALVRVQC